MKKLLWVAAATLPIWSAPAQSATEHRKHLASEHHSARHGQANPDKANPAKATLSHSEVYDAAIAEQAKIHGVPEELVHRVVQRESRYDPGVVHKSFLGLMQITYATASSMGYKGAVNGLLDARTNLMYAVPYLANAYIVAGKNLDRAVALYASGYYYEAKRKHMLALLRSAKSEPVEPPPEVTVVAAQAPPAPSANPVSQLFHALVGPANPPTQEAGLSPPEASAPVQQAEGKASEPQPAATEQAMTQEPSEPQSNEAKAPRSKHQIAQAKVAKTKGAQTDLAQTDLAQTAPTQTKEAKTEVAKSPARQTHLKPLELAQLKSIPVPVARTQVARAQVSHSEVSRPEISRFEAAHPDVGLRATSIAPTQ